VRERERERERDTETGEERARCCRSLGDLSYVRIWHDNTGGGSDASWFLKYMIVRDLQTKQTWYFICQRWLAVEEDDGMVRVDDGVSV
jgi:hypothetical protein